MSILETPRYSVVIPVYKNRETLADLLEVLGKMNRKLSGELEAVFVVDGSPDDCLEILAHRLPTVGYCTQLVSHSKNFGAFQAIRTGLTHARGEFFTVLSADLQEPPSLMLQFFHTLETEPVDVVIGTRESRQDPMLSGLSAKIFWGLYRRLIQKEMPSGGVDIFGCNKAFRDRLVELTESNSSLVGQVMWLGFRRKLIPYHRQARTTGKSAWTLSKKMRYFMDSVFSFTDLPVLALFFFGQLGLGLALALAVFTIVAKITGAIEIPGYAMTVFTICFFSGINLLGLGIIGMYVWRAYENTKARPLGVVAQVLQYDGQLETENLGTSNKGLKDVVLPTSTKSV